MNGFQTDIVDMRKEKNNIDNYDDHWVFSYII